MKIVICSVKCAGKDKKEYEQSKVEAMARALKRACAANGIDVIAVCEKVLTEAAKLADEGMPCWEAEAKYELLGLEKTKTGKMVGMIGSETTFVDCNGATLHVGDLVEVTEADGAQLDNLYFAHHKANWLFKRGRKVKLVKPYKQVEIGEKHGDFRVVALSKVEHE